jgi:HK97 family phage portal protein
MRLVPAFLTDAFRGIQIGRELRNVEARSSFSATDAWLLSALAGGPTKSGASVNENTAFNVSVIRACIGLRSWLLASLPLKVYQKTARGSEEQRDHPLARLFRGKVAPGFTRYKWVSVSQVCFDLGGNAYARVFRNSYAEPERIVWQKPAAVTPLENTRTGDIGWRIQGAERDLHEHEVVHIANLSTNGRTGRSPLADLRESVGLALTAQEASARTFSNGNRKPGVIEAAPATKLTAAQEFAAYWLANYAGVANAGKTPIMGGGFTWKDAGVSNQEAELLGSRKFEVEEIARVYQIPLHLVGSTEKATTWGSGIEQLNQGLVDYMLRPLCENWEAELNTTLLSEAELAADFYVKFNVDALLRGSPKTRAEVYQIMRGIRAITVNEIRKREDWMEFPDVGANNPEWPLNNQGGGNQAPAKAEANASADSE